MPISWNEIRQNAITFAKEWATARSESGEKQSFWNDFFEVFGMRRRAVASFEEPVRQITGRYGRIDLFWRGMLLVEHKSRGEDLGKAESQAFEYIQDLIREGRQDEVPRYVIVSDFARIALHDLDPEEDRPLPLFAGYRVASVEFPLAELHRQIHAFAFIAGYQQQRFQDHDPINLRAVAIMDDLHKTLEAGGYSRARTGTLLGACPLLPLCRGHGHFRARGVSALPRGPHEAGRIGPGPSSGTPLRRPQHAAGEAAEEPRRDPSGVSLCQRRAFRGGAGFRRLQPPHAQQPPGLHAFRLVADFARHLRLALSRRHGSRASAGRSAATTPANATSSRWCGRCFSTT